MANKSSIFWHIIPNICHRIFSVIKTSFDSHYTLKCILPPPLPIYGKHVVHFFVPQTFFGGNGNGFSSHYGNWNSACILQIIEKRFQKHDNKTLFKNTSQIWNYNQLSDTPSHNINDIFCYGCNFAYYRVPIQH